MICRSLKPVSPGRRGLIDSSGSVQTLKPNEGIFVDDPAGDCFSVNCRHVGPEKGQWFSRSRFSRDSLEQVLSSFPNRKAALVQVTGGPKNSSIKPWLERGPLRLAVGGRERTKLRHCWARRAGRFAWRIRRPRQLFAALLCSCPRYSSASLQSHSLRACFPSAQVDHNFSKTRPRHSRMFKIACAKPSHLRLAIGLEESNNPASEGGFDRFDRSKGPMASRGITDISDGDSTTVRFFHAAPLMCPDLAESADTTACQDEYPGNGQTPSRRDRVTDDHIFALSIASSEVSVASWSHLTSTATLNSHWRKQSRVYGDTEVIVGEPISIELEYPWRSDWFRSNPFGGSSTSRLLFGCILGPPSSTKGHLDESRGFSEGKG